MAYQEGETLESLLGKATHPTNRQEDWEYIMGFCDQVNREFEGPQTAVKLLICKIYYSQEWEALQALTVLEACMKNCGRRFQYEVGRYRFLNDLIKLVSPTYVGNSTPEKVRRKIVEMVYSWTIAFPNETKIKKAYHAMTIEGLVTLNPDQPVDRTLIASPPPRPKHPVFDNEDMGKLLAELLRSKNPEDLQEANRLIKNMVKEDEVRVQKFTKRVHTLEEVSINVRLLTEMLSHYSRNIASDSDKEIIKELYERCDKLRSTTFKMATDTEDNDATLGDILQASDDLSKVINSYKKIFEGQPDSEEPPLAEITDTLVDLSGVDTPSPPQPALPPPQSSPPVSHKPSVSNIPFLPPPPKSLAGSYGRSRNPSQPSLDKTSSALSLLDDKLLSLDMNDPPTSLSSQTEPRLDELSAQWTSLQAPAASMDMLGSAACLDPVVPPVEPAAAHGLQNLHDLAMMCFSDQQRLSSQMTAKEGGFRKQTATPPLLPGQGSPSTSSFLHSAAPGSPAISHSKAQSLDMAPGSPLFHSLSPCHRPLHGSPIKGPDFSLSNVHVPLETIRPSKVLPVTAYDKNGVRVLLNFASDCPPGRPDVLVMVVSMLNTAPLPVHNVLLQAAVPKSMKVKLQPPSGTELAAFNPVLTAASITQIMLLANPAKETVRLRYKLGFTLGDRQCNEIGEVDQFPPPETWGHL
ncbi:ADP-ribosylation factor-binding protein GGA3 [Menidia menidia]